MRSRSSQDDKTVPKFRNCPIYWTYYVRQRLDFWTLVDRLQGFIVLTVAIFASVIALTLGLVASQSLSIQLGAFTFIAEGLGFGGLIMVETVRYFLEKRERERDRGEKTLQRHRREIALTYRAISNGARLSSTGRFHVAFDYGPIRHANTPATLLLLEPTSKTLRSISPRITQNFILYWTQSSNQ